MSERGLLNRAGSIVQAAQRKGATAGDVRQLQTIFKSLQRQAEDKHVKDSARLSLRELVDMGQALRNEDTRSVGISLAVLAQNIGVAKAYSRKARRVVRAAKRMDIRRGS